MKKVFYVYKFSNHFKKIYQRTKIASEYQSINLRSQPVISVICQVSQ